MRSMKKSRKLGSQLPRQEMPAPRIASSSAPVAVADGARGGPAQGGRRCRRRRRRRGARLDRAVEQRRRVGCRPGRSTRPPRRTPPPRPRARPWRRAIAASAGAPVPHPAMNRFARVTRTSPVLAAGRRGEPQLHPAARGEPLAQRPVGGHARRPAARRTRPGSAAEPRAGSVPPPCSRNCAVSVPRHPPRRARAGSASATASVPSLQPRLAVRSRPRASPRPDPRLGRLDRGGTVARGAGPGSATVAAYCEEDEVAEPDRLGARSRRRRRPARCQP